MHAVKYQRHQWAWICTSADREGGTRSDRGRQTARNGLGEAWRRTRQKSCLVTPSLPAWRSHSGSRRSGRRKEAKERPQREGETAMAHDLSPEHKRLAAPGGPLADEGWTRKTAEVPAAKIGRWTPTSGCRGASPCCTRSMPGWARRRSRALKSSAGTRLAAPTLRRTLEATDRTPTRRALPRRTARSCGACAAIRTASRARSAMTAAASMATGNSSTRRGTGNPGWRSR